MFNGMKGKDKDTRRESCVELEATNRLPACHESASAQKFVRNSVTRPRMRQKRMLEIYHKRNVILFLVLINPFFFGNNAVTNPKMKNMCSGHLCNIIFISRYLVKIHRLVGNGLSIIFTIFDILSNKIESI